MNKREVAIREQLKALSEPQYAAFITSLIPGCDNVMGVRIPTLRKMAKTIVKDEPLIYLREVQTQFFEETMIKGLVIGNLKVDFDTVLEQVALFIPQITNWSLCDSFCSELKIVRRYKEKAWAFIEPYHQSEETYEVRFAVVTMLFHYIETDYIERILHICDTIKHEDYYVKMAVAWALSMCFVKYPEQTMRYLQNNTLDDTTYNKALQKIRESRQVDQSTKEVIKAMRRK